MDLNKVLEDHNNWLRTNGKSGSRANFEGLELINPNFLNANLEKASLKNTKILDGFLIGATFKEAECQNAIFKNSYLGTCNFSETNLSGADLSNSILLGTNFTSANLTGCNLISAKEIQEAIFENTIFSNTIIDKQNFQKIKQILKTELLDDFIIIEVSKDVNIVREISFRPEHMQAGISILSYFGKVLTDKQSEIDQSVLIKQHKSKVSLIIQTKDGDKHVVEKELLDYGSVIKGELSIEEFLPNQIQALELRNQLQILKTQIECQKQIFQISEKVNNEILKEKEKRIESLDEEVHWLRSKISQGVLDHNSRLDQLISDVNLNEKYRGLLQELKDILLNEGSERAKKNPRTFQIKEKLREAVLTKTVSSGTGEVIKSLIETVFG